MEVKARESRNKLNELSGKEWIKFTKTWFIHRPLPRENAKLLHPAAFPESLIAQKRGQSLNTWAVIFTPTASVALFISFSFPITYLKLNDMYTFHRQCQRIASYSLFILYSFLSFPHCFNVYSPSAPKIKLYAMLI